MRVLPVDIHHPDVITLSKKIMLFRAAYTHPSLVSTSFFPSVLTLFITGSMNNFWCETS